MAKKPRATFDPEAGENEYTLGYDAYFDGFTLSDNPFRKGSPGAIMWRNGFAEAARILRGNYF